MKRVFLIVLDSFGIGEMPDAEAFGDRGSSTIASCAASREFFVPNMEKLGLFHIDGVGLAGSPDGAFTGTVARMTERSMGKDTTIGHWEIAGHVSPRPLPVFPEGFPQEVLAPFRAATGRGVLCNKPYSGTQVIEDYGRQHMDTGDLIVYTSADSVFQIAAHEDVVPVEQLYTYCQAARQILTGPYGVGRVIARPFVGEPGHFTRTSNRHDFSLEPPGPTMCDVLSQAGLDVIGVGKINDIFAGKGITEFVRTTGNDDGMAKTMDYAKKAFHGLCFVNLVDFDMLYGHRNNVDGYARALSRFDEQLPTLMEAMGPEDLLILTADHGCDPATPSTDHSREYTPMVAWSPAMKGGVNLGTRDTFADIAATVAEYLSEDGCPIENTLDGTSFLREMGL